MKKLIRKYFVFSLLFLSFSFAWSQGLIQTRNQPIKDQAMVITGDNQLEVLPNSRAIPQTNQATQPSSNIPYYRLIQTNAAAPINNKQLGIAYDHALNKTVFLTGEVSFKLKTGASLNTVLTGLQGANTSAPSLLVPPNIYVFYATTPQQIVSLTNQLKASSLVDWADAYVLNGRLNNE